MARFLVAELRIRKPGINIQKIGFADKVKEISHDIFGWADLKPGYYYEDEKHLVEKEFLLPKLGKSPRDIWIGVGNGVRSATGCDGVWSDYIFNTIDCDVLILKDLRFPKEAQDILRHGGYVYRIDRDSCPKIEDNADDKLEEFDKWTGIITNNGSFNDLHAEVLKLIERHFNA